jgi:hypothetical protein
LIGFLVVAVLLLGAGARGYFAGRAEAKDWARRGREKAVAAGAPSYASLVRAQVLAAVRPTWWLAPASGPVFSKVGGTPDLPANFDWPTTEEGDRDFVAQLDLAELKAAQGPDWLPAEGRLYAFYCERLGCGDLVQLIYSRDPVAEGARDGRRASYAERHVQFLAAKSLPSSDWLGVDPRELGDDDDPAGWMALVDLQRPPTPSGAPEHRIGGYPSEIQSAQLAVECEHLARGLPDPDYRKPIDPEVAKAAESWRLLLQIDSDDDLGMNWVDGGRLYVFVREADARAGDFSKAISVAQFY